MTIDSVVIVGAGIGGVSVARVLRSEGFDGTINLIGAEILPPYQRPPLSKDILTAAELSFESVSLGGHQELSDLRIQTYFGDAAIGIDLGSRAAILGGGTAVKGDRIVIATGGRPRPLMVAGAAIEGILTLRNWADAVRLRATLKPDANVAVIGAGVIGAEVASSAKTRGCNVSMIDTLAYPMTRAAGAEAGAALGSKYQAAGIDLHMGVSVAEFCGGRRLASIKLSNGVEIEADLAVIGIGVSLETQILTGLVTFDDSGVQVDAACRTSQPEIYAIGDIAKQRRAMSDVAIRAETYTNAQTQAQRVALDILGRPQPSLDVPWFWSDQFGVNIQGAGSIESADHSVWRRPFEDDRGLQLFFSSNRVVGAVGVNAQREMGTVRKLIESRISFDSHALADPAQELRSFLPQQH